LGCQLRRPVGRPGHVGRAGAVVGVDAGVRALAVLSRPVPGLTDAEGKVPNPRRLARVAGRLRRQQRRVARRVGPDDPAARSRRRPSRRQQQARRRLARLHGQVRDARADGWHKLTTALAQRFDTVVVEDLNVAGMLARPAPKPDRRGRWARNGTAAKTGLARSTERASPLGRRRRARPAAPAAGVQDGLVQLAAARGEPVLPVEQNLLGLRPGPRPRPQRRAQPGPTRRARYRECPGNRSRRRLERTWRPGKPRPASAGRARVGET
jgi:hypothetical protein